MKVVFLAVGVLAVAVVAFHFATTVHAAKASALAPARKALFSTSFSLPMFFEPNQGQTSPQVKFLARGAGYGLFLTADEAVLRLQRATSAPHSAVSAQPLSSSVIQMHLEGSNPSARISGASPLTGKSNYFIGNDPSKWRSGIPQFAQVKYEAVYPGVDLVYYGNQGQLEYDFRVAPGAEPNQIALNFKGASAHIISGDAGDSGDLILSTADGDVRFHAPVIYQQDGNNRKTVAGSFRQLADNKIGFTIGNYDHNRELVIDPVLSYSSYLGGTDTESLVKVAVDSAQLIYLAGSTTSAYFFPPPVNGGSPPLQNTLNGTQNLFIAVINPTPNPGVSQLVFATYLGGDKVDNLAGITVDANFSIYVAGTTTSDDFPTTPNAFQTAQTVTENNGFPGTHGFLSAITLGLNSVYTLGYSTYLAGSGVDTVTGLAVDTTQDAYVTGVTTSTNDQSNGFPSNPNGYQLLSNAAPGGSQFFASEINTKFSGSESMIYSTYFGGGNPGNAANTGGGIAVDPTTSNVNMYITGTTNMLPTGINGGKGFPLLNSQQSCLDEASTTSCNGTSPTNTDGFVAKINPNPQTGGSGASSLIYSTYIGGSGTDSAAAISVDSSGNAYVTGTTNSTDWVCKSCVPGFQGAYPPGAISNAFVVKIGNQIGSNFPLAYFT